jgi:hypothetical protein
MDFENEMSNPRRCKLGPGFLVHYVSRGIRSTRVDRHLAQALGVSWAPGGRWKV